MRLYYEDEEATIAAILRHGFLSVLGSDRELMCCDCSLAGLGPASEPHSIPAPEGLAEIAFEVEADVSAYEVFPMDMPPGRYFDIPVIKIEETMQGLRSPWL